ncbi:hypothetical protein [Streptomyces sp. cg35]|uniref:hypothetical protein n=1 Tax=Streptomyces sp. cg35 TaxID=3421650 RepID=UPI003D1772DB
MTTNDGSPAGATSGAGTMALRLRVHPAVELDEGAVKERLRARVNDSFTGKETGARATAVTMTPHPQDGTTAFVTVVVDLDRWARSGAFGTVTALEAAHQLGGILANGDVLGGEDGLEVEYEAPQLIVGFPVG